MLGDNDDEDVGMIQYNHASNFLAFTVNTAERLRITSTGLVGVNCTPVGMFEVQKNGVPAIIANYNNSKHIQMGAGANGAGFHLTDGNFFSINHQPYADRGTDNNLTERIRIDSNGNLNLGLTASPVSSSTEQGVFLAGADSTQSVISSNVTPFVVNRMGTGGNDRNCIEFRNNGTLRGTIGAIGASDGLFFQAGSSERFRITSDGKLLVGVSSGSNHHISSGASTLNTVFQANLGGAGATCAIRVKMNTSANDGLQIQQNGSGTAISGGNHATSIFNRENARMRFGTNNSEQFRIESNGDLKGTDTSIGSLSDSRLKKNIADFIYDLSKFKQFKPRTFDWINPKLHGSKSGVRGFIAQEIETIDTSLVGNYELYDESLTDKNPDLEIIKADDGSNIAKDSKLGTNDAMYISVIQQMLTKIETLEAKVATLEGS
jgi:hypothetical protein